MTIADIICKASFGATAQNTIDGSLTASVVQALSFSSTITSGTTAGKADRVWKDSSRSLSGATSENIDMYDLAAFNIGGGAGNDGLGVAWVAADVIGVMILNDTTSTGNLTVGGEGSAAAWNSPFSASDTFTFGPIGPGGMLFFFNPIDPAWAVADSSNHLLKIASSDTLTYTIAVLARSA